MSDAARSRQPWTGLHHHQAKTPEKAQEKQCYSNQSVASVLTHSRIPLPHWRQSHKPHSNAAENTLRKLDGISCQRSAARRSYGAKIET